MLPEEKKSEEGDEVRRFPPPWRAIEMSESYVVEDATGQHVAYVYFAAERSRRLNLRRLTRDEARRIAAGIVRLPELVKRP